jgi:hypothetical protein
VVVLAEDGDGGPVGVQERVLVFEQRGDFALDAPDPLARARVDDVVRGGDVADAVGPDAEGLLAVGVLKRKSSFSLSFFFFTVRMGVSPSPS